jgi:hypothetical protein
MATRFKEDLIWNTEWWHIRVENSTGIADRFFQKAEESLKQIEFPNITAEVNEFKTGGIFFNKEVTRMLSINPEKSAFKELGVYLRAQSFGNMVVFSKFDTVEKDFWDKITVTSNYEKYEEIQSRCKNLAQKEELASLLHLGDEIWADALSVIDPNCEIKSLKNQLKGKRTGK